MNERLEIAEELLGHSLEAGGFAPCPGLRHHTKGNGARDFRVLLDGAPTGFCLHQSCAEEVAAFNKELRRRVWMAEHRSEGWSTPEGREKAKAWGVAQEPRVDVEARPPLDRDKVAEFLRGVPPVTEEWLRRRSAIDPTSAGTTGFLDALYEPGERTLIFTDERSQGDFLWWRGGRGETEAERAPSGKSRGFRLSQTQGVRAVPSALPPGGPKGVWFLTQPVTALWAINPNSMKGGGCAKYSRRCEATVTAWRYYVLESDELETAEWLRVVASLPFPIAAIYTSGVRSVHALVRCEMPTKAGWDQVRNAMRPIVCPLGADAAALTAVRLSRLPGCLRGDRPQRLLYLDPQPDHTAIRTKREVRE